MNVAERADTYGIDVAIESRPEFDWNPRPLNSVQMLQLTEPSGHEFNSHSEPTLYSYSRFIVCLL